LNEIALFFTSGGLDARRISRQHGTVLNAGFREDHTAGIQPDARQNRLADEV
jgi:hypothetical protein